MFKKEAYYSLAYSAASINCCGIVFAFLMAISPYFVWSTLYGAGVFVGSRTTLASGAFILSSSDSRVQTVGAIFYSGQTNYWADMTSAIACTGDMYSKWSSVYGYCDAENGTFQIPSEVITVQVCSIMSVCFLFVSIVAALAVEGAIKPAIYVSAFFSLAAMITACVSFSTVASSAWNRDLISSGGGPFPLRDETGTWGVLDNVPFWYGPSFGGSIFIFISAFFATCTLLQAFCLFSKTSDSPDDFVDDNKDVPGGAGTGAESTDPGYGEPRGPEADNVTKA